ncbi:tyrosine-protein phosphatase [Streptomyces sp. NBC_00620]|uniref:tyrosine-protein phosphatase n=1 Tax=Streptomyces sp. NBC_00620 TaxID=2903666 RepID=UPI0022553A02|nr:tyrosine-protein phosphatase [Streptomyces sp. NBC_00620]MCX4973472.1 tyrosine-protein phosphatase [Streptomyces sp. NBC_00620]
MKNLTLAGVALALTAVSVSLTTPAALAAPAKHTAATSRIPFTAATVTANDNGSYRIVWKAPGVRSVAIRANGHVVARGGTHGDVTVSGLPAADRQWFDLVPQRGGSLHLADRLVKLDGAVNFRDAGGYRTADGHWVKMGEIYRSDALNRLTDADLAKLERLGIEAVYDLRMASERTSAPDRVPSGAAYTVADVLAGSATFTTMPTTEDEAVEMMVEGEKFMVSGDSARAAYSAVFAGVADESQHGLLYHCTAGKDRTGWSSAALLTALGVPRATVMDDYLASNTYRATVNAATLAAMPAAQAKVYKPLLDVRPEYLNSGFTEVSTEYGSFNSYLRKGLGIDTGELRALKRDLLIG